MTASTGGCPRAWPMNDQERKVADIIRHHVKHTHADAVIDIDKLAKDIVRRQAIDLATEVLASEQEMPPIGEMYCTCVTPEIYDSTFGKACAKCNRFYVR